MEILQLQLTKKNSNGCIHTVSRLGNHPLKELEVRDFALILDEWLDKDMVSTARVNRGLWVDIYKEAQHAGESSSRMESSGGYP